MCGFVAIFSNAEKFLMSVQLLWELHALFFLVRIIIISPLLHFDLDQHRLIIEGKLL